MTLEYRDEVVEITYESNPPDVDGSGQRFPAYISLVSISIFDQPIDLTKQTAAWKAVIEKELESRIEEENRIEEDFDDCR